MSQNRWECMVSKTVYFALSFHEEHRKSQLPRRTYHHSSYELHETMDYVLTVSRNCPNYNHFHPRHSFAIPITSVQCVHIFCRGNYVYISSRHTFLIEISVFRFVDSLDCLNTILIYKNIAIMLRFVCFIICPIVITGYVT